MNTYEFTVDQRMVDKIVARAQNSACGLGNPEKGPHSYDIDRYDPPNLHSLAIMLVSAHFEKWEIISIVTAALEEVAEQTANVKALQEALILSDGMPSALPSPSPEPSKSPLADSIRDRLKEKRSK